MASHVTPEYNHAYYTAFWLVWAVAFGAGVAMAWWWLGSGIIRGGPA